MSLPPRAAFGRQMWPSVCAKAVWLRASAHLVVFGLPFDAPQPTRGNPGWCVACSAANRDGSSRCHGPDAIDVAAVEGVGCSLRTSASGPSTCSGGGHITDGPILLRSSADEGVALQSHSILGALRWPHRVLRPLHQKSPTQLSRTHMRLGPAQPNVRPNAQRWSVFRSCQARLSKHEVALEAAPSWP